jgi:hypothetical protein
MHRVGFEAMTPVYEQAKTFNASDRAMTVADVVRVFHHTKFCLRRVLVSLFTITFGTSILFRAQTEMHYRIY